MELGWSNQDRLPHDVEVEQQVMVSLYVSKSKSPNFMSTFNLMIFKV